MSNDNSRHRRQVVLLSSLASHAGGEDPHAATERVIAGGSYATTQLQPGTFMSNAIWWSHQARTTGQIRLPYLDAEEAPSTNRTSPTSPSASSWTAPATATTPARIH